MYRSAFISSDGLDGIYIRSSLKQKRNTATRVQANGRTWADLNLIPTDNLAFKVYKGQVKQLAQKPEDKLAVIQSENKLQRIGFVDFVDNLNETEKALITGKFQYYIPWHVVWKENSIRTACRIVFDASMTVPGGCSLNSLLAKGVNSMNKLVEIVIRWMTYICAFHTDINKM